MARAKTQPNGDCGEECITTTFVGAYGHAIETPRPELSLIVYGLRVIPLILSTHP